MHGLKSLKYIHIDGTLDWNQPIENFDFVNGLPELEVFSLGWIINKSEYPALRPLMNLKKLSRIKIIGSIFPTPEYAFLEVALPDVQGSKEKLFWECGDRLEFLGKKAGWTGINSPKREGKCKEFVTRYDELRLNARQFIKS